MEQGRVQRNTWMVCDTRLGQGNVMATSREVRTEHGLEYAVIGGAAVYLLWLGIAETAALVAGGNHLLPNLASSISGLGTLIAHGNPVSGWSPADRHDLPSAAVFILTGVIELALVAASVIAVWRKVSGGKQDKSSRAPAKREIHAHLSLAAVRDKTAHLRSDIENVHKAKGEDIGLLLGRETTTHQQVWAAGDDSVLMVGPPGSGKTASFIIPAIVEAPGAVVATSTRDEVVSRTAKWRQRDSRPCWVFAPQLDVEVDGVDELRWSPLAGCDNPLTAITRAAALVKGGAGFGSSTTNADFWEASGIAVMRCYLLAAATGGKTMADVLSWAASPAASEPAKLLSSIAPGWATELRRVGTGPGNLVSSIWAGVRRSLDCFSDPRVLAACSTGTNFDIGEFLKSKGTAYLVGSGSSQLSVAPLIAALVEAIADTARQPKGRGNLTVPLSLILDEAANIAPLPSLPTLLSEGGGSGIQTLVVLQSLAQGRHRWSLPEMDAMWDASTIKLILPGMSHAADLEAISKLCGEIEETRTAKTTGSGGASTSEQAQSKPAWTPEQIRGLQTGHALLLPRRLRPVEIESEPYWKREARWNDG